MPDKNPDASPGASHNAVGIGHTREEMLRTERPRGLKRWGIIAVVVALILAVVGIALRYFHSEGTRSWTDDQAVPTVQVLKLQGSSHGGVLNLPGDIQAFTNAPINAQVSGYVQSWSADIGAKVKKGQLLAQIDPRTYQAALDQAKGSLARDTANLTNARLDLNRYKALAAQNAISAQQLSTQEALVNSDAGIVETDRAAVEQAAINLAYTRIIAPIDGTVTSRAIDVGALVTVGIAATPLFTISAQDKLRIYVRVPQNYAAAIKPGMQVTFTVPQYPGRPFTADLVASAGAVSSATGTMLVQFGIDNSDGALQPGGYAEVKFPLPAGINGLRIPATALIFRDAGMLVAVVDSGNRARMKKINIQSDDGATVEASGLSASERVIDNPSDSLQDGDPVHIAGK